MSTAIGLILIDIDGTLVGTEDVIAPAVWDAVDEARAAGVHLAICTGRPGSGDALHYARLVSPDEPHIFQSGASVNWVDGRTVHVVEFPAASYPGQVGLARRTGQAFEVYTPTACFIERQTPWGRAHEEAIGLTTTLVPDLLDLPDRRDVDGPVVRTHWVVPWGQWPPIEDEIRGDGGLEVSVARHADLTGACFTSVTARGISKASAAAVLARHHGLSLARTAMVGDGDNDLSVLRAVGLPIAMGNGTDAVKAAAAHTVAHVDDGGLAEAIRVALQASPGGYVGG